MADAAAPATSPPPSVATTVVVREGQSLWDIATARGISVEAVAEANGLSNAELIRPGQRLVIPPSGASARMQKPIMRTTTKPQVRAARAPARRQQPASGWVVVRQGQTLSEIADQHKTTVRSLVDTNGLRSAHAIRVGQRILIPGRGAGSGGGMAAALLPASRSQAAVVRVAGFLWPARGVLTSRFGWRWRRHHDGIDIAAPRGTPVHAARAGRVIFSGWYYGYGRAVIVDHGEGLTTLYGHNSTLLVRTGESVTSGQLIARVGCTGRCYGSHLHFEIRVNGRAVNPLKYL
ncbi:MAG TPA: M23 family metallopeptidase [bacterium]|nr:M23 family metallopeptidase [bacterium]